MKRIQWIVRVLKDETNQNWSKLIENYLRCLDNKYGINLFTLKVTDANDEVNNCRIPAFYKECIMYFGNLCQIAKEADKEPTTNSIINHSISLIGQCLVYS